MKKDRLENFLLGAELEKAMRKDLVSPWGAPCGVTGNI
jgi:hypothetical protein